MRTQRRPPSATLRRHPDDVSGRNGRTWGGRRWLPWSWGLS